ncbi:MAG: SGNH/GDSL hydrolase family protein [Ktedonobacteraceae bacterium]
MKAKHIATVLVLSCSLITYGAARGVIHQLARPPVPPTLVVLGDSISAGQYLPDSYDAYPHLLATDLHARLTVYAVPGHTTAQTHSMYTGELAPSYAVIELGTNDYNKGIPLAIFAAAYQSIVASISSATREVCLSVWDPSNIADTAWSSPRIPSPVNRVGGSPAAYNAIIAQSCRETYLSLQSIYEISTYHGVGASGPLYHPNIAGDAAIARLVYSVLQPHIDRPLLNAQASPISPAHASGQFASE